MSLVETWESGSSIGGVDVRANEVEIDTVGWDSPAPALELSHPVDRTVSGRCLELTIHWVSVAIGRMRSDGTLIPERRLGLDRDELELEADRYQLTLNAEMDTLIRFDGAASIRRIGDRSVKISFEHPTAVTVGFQTPIRRPEATITTTADLSGVAIALGHLAAALRVSTASVTAQSNRRHPPAIEFDTAVSVPEAVRERTPDTDLELRLPADLAYFFPAAPLAYYLGTSVSVDSDSPPTLVDASGDSLISFEPLPGFEKQAGSLLRRVGFLDNYVRSVHDGLEPRSGDVLREMEFDPDQLLTAGPLERLQTYLELDQELLETVLPEWHSVIYVEPTIDRIRSLPYVLVQLPQIRLIQDAHPQQSDLVGGKANDPLRPFIGWLGSDPPALAYEASLESYRHAVETRVHRTDPDRLVVIDTGSGEAGQEAVEVFLTRESVPVEPEFHRTVKKKDLADLLASGADFLYFAGETNEGFECEDGTLKIDESSEVNARLVFLDDADSDSLGRACIEAGAATVIVRRNSSSADLSSGVRRAFHRLLTDGFEVNRCRRYVKRFVDPNSDLHVIGDGMLALSVANGMYPVARSVEPLGNRQFAITAQTLFSEPFWRWSADVPDGDAWMIGSYGEFVVDATQVSILLSRTDDVFIYDEQLYWPDDARAFYPFV